MGWPEVVSEGIIGATMIALGFLMVCWWRGWPGSSRDEIEVVAHVCKDECCAKPDEGTPDDAPTLLRRD